MRRKWFFIAPLAMLGMLAFVALGGEIVRLLWNWLVPALFGLRTITFWEGLGLLVLCRILFGGHGMFGRGHSNMRSRIRERMAEKWERMTPEEREKARERYAKYCGPFEPPKAEPTA